MNEIQYHLGEIQRIANELQHSLSEAEEALKGMVKECKEEPAYLTDTLNFSKVYNSVPKSTAEGFKRVYHNSYDNSPNYLDAGDAHELAMKEGKGYIKLSLDLNHD